LCVSRSHQNSNLNRIQISLQIIKRFEKEKDFLIPIWQWAETQLDAEPGPASRSFSPSHFSIFVWPNSGPAASLTSWPSGTDPSDSRTEFMTNSKPNGIRPLLDFSPANTGLSSVRDRIARTFSQLRFGARSPINSGRFPSNFCHKDQALGAAPQRRLRRSTMPHAQPRAGKASLAACTSVGSKDRTRASPGELAIEQEQRSEPPNVARSLCTPPMHKVSKKGLTSSF
jgi:hypothetical protein